MITTDQEHEGKTQAEKVEGNTNENPKDSSAPPEAKGEGKDYEILGENYPTYDYAFKIILVGNSGIFLYL